MADMLVKLYDLPDVALVTARVVGQGIAIRRSLVPEKPAMLAWIQTHFPAWAPEVEATYARLPVSVFLALKEQEIVGFACVDALCRNFFGPMAVLAAQRRRGVGRALLLTALVALREQGYAYAIVGGVGPSEFYTKAAGAVPIAGSTPGLYAGMLRNLR
jgi:GNAT superfamily N-acetyltransferase